MSVICEGYVAHFLFLLVISFKIKEFMWHRAASFIHQHFAENFRPNCTQMFSSYLAVNTISPLPIDQQLNAVRRNNLFLIFRNA
jgi:hypothetical protein